MNALLQSCFFQGVISVPNRIWFMGPLFSTDIGPLLVGSWILIFFQLNPLRNTSKYWLRWPIISDWMRSIILNLHVQQSDRLRSFPKKTNCFRLIFKSFGYLFCADKVKYTCTLKTWKLDMHIEGNLDTYKHTVEHRVYFSH